MHRRSVLLSRSDVLIAGFAACTEGLSLCRDPTFCSPVSLHHRRPVLLSCAFVVIQRFVRRFRCMHRRSVPLSRSDTTGKSSLRSLHLAIPDARTHECPAKHPSRRTCAALSRHRSSQSPRLRMVKKLLSIVAIQTLYCRWTNPAWQRDDGALHKARGNRGGGRHL